MISVVYACNDAYIRQTLVSAASVWKYNPDAKIYLVGDGISKENIEQVNRFSETYGKAIYIYELADVLPELNLNEKDRHPHTIYVKLFLTHIVKEERILYLDSDVLVQGSLEELFRRDMTNELAAGVLMPYSKKVKAEMRISQGAPYICDGVVLINLERWKKESAEQRCVQYIEEWNGNPPMLSEGTLNYVCKGEIGVLHPKYNLMPSMLMYRLEEIIHLFRADHYYSKKTDMTEAVEKPVIIHYMNELYNRPWFETSDHPYRDHYRKMEKEIFGENQLINKPLEQHTRRTVWLRNHLPFGIFAALYHIKNKLY